MSDARPRIRIDPHSAKPCVNQQDTALGRRPPPRALVNARPSIGFASGAGIHPVRYERSGGSNVAGIPADKRFETEPRDNLENDVSGLHESGKLQSCTMRGAANAFPFRGVNGREKRKPMQKFAVRDQLFHRRLRRLLRLRPAKRRTNSGVNRRCRDLIAPVA